MSGRLANKITVVTGAASGIGFATAERFAEEGAQVVAVDVDIARLDRFTLLSGQIDHAVLALVTDIADASQIKTAISRIMGKYGCIDILVNSAAIFDMTPLAEASEKALARSRQVNVLGTRNFMDEVARAMITKGTKGSIINVSSVSGMGGEADKTVYSKTKAEILELTQSSALRLGHSGIRLNSVSPGPIFTEASLKHMEQIGVDEKTFTEGAKTGTVMGRMGTPEEVASAILFLASDEASYITGVNLVVDGGFSVVQNSYNRD